MGKNKEVRQTKETFRSEERKKNEQHEESDRKYRNLVVKKRQKRIKEKIDWI